MKKNITNFWWKNSGYISSILMPFSIIYSFFAKKNITNRLLKKINLPVLCIGNFTLGGDGKTPTVIAISKVAKNIGYTPGVISRGFGRKINKTYIVNENYNTALEVGDEPLLIAKHAKIVVSNNRYLAAKILQKIGCDIIIMDDGFQSGYLYADYTLIVINSIRGFGNCNVFPSGPLRAPLEIQLFYADGLLLIQNKKNNIYHHSINEIYNKKKPIYYAYTNSFANFDINKKKFIAFSGIGCAEKFFNSIRNLGGIVIREYIFIDHYFFTKSDIKKISKIAKKNSLFIATTAKDYVRIIASKLDKELDKLIIFDIEINFENCNFGKNLIYKTIAKYKNRNH